jgi:excisionase family DNA binding protein
MEGFHATTAIAPKALKIRQAAEYLSISPVSLRRLIKRGLIKPNLALRHYLVPTSELDRFLEGGQQ